MHARAPAMKRPVFPTRAARLLSAWVVLVLLSLPVPVAATTVLLLGDSLSSGYGLDGAGWVEMANRQLAEKGAGIRIVNDSISGDTTAGGLARIEDGIGRTDPDWVMIELGGNDGLRGVRPSVIEDNLRRMVEISESRGIRAMLLGIRIPPNYGKIYTERFAQVFENVSADKGIPLLPFFIGELALDPGYMQPDMIHPNDAAQPLIRDRVVAFLVSVLND